MAGPPLHSERERAQSNQQAGHAQQLDPAYSGRFLHCIQKGGVCSRRIKTSVWRQRSSSQLLRASGQARGFQVTLQLPHRASVQGAKVEVKSSVCDVEVSSFFDEVHDLQSREHNGSERVRTTCCVFMSTLRTLSCPNYSQFMIY